VSVVVKAWVSVVRRPHRRHRRSSAEGLDGFPTGKALPDAVIDVLHVVA